MVFLFKLDIKTQIMKQLYLINLSILLDYKQSFVHLIIRKLKNKDTGEFIKYTLSLSLESSEVNLQLNHDMN